ncbi:hypothetical protein SLH49_05945 [Cognatiyoonia sp. IB215446]|uniref:hypothetical protein n=1 Tax=Cognatiyoonia sp. IB215446 TaxID=3097355 RepID=UPI002A13E022|nr:hypothetical protein [Cognatiyoonia sp. IB215446]MDX8347524.1 hypothetical protein [Cognatiyoonia sp. IB215446]
MAERADIESEGREADREALFFEILTSNKITVSDEALAYFRKHPEEVDEVTAATRVHMFFLWVGLGVGIVAVAMSKLLSALPLEDYIGGGFEEFLVELVFEGGVALIGAALTAYFLGVLLNRQQERAKAFRKEIRRKLREDAP